jgi:glycine oxidase
MEIAIIGAGVAGLCCACESVDRGLSVDLYEQSNAIGEAACSWYAGGMLAPWCEAESAEAVVIEWGQHAIAWWDSHVSPLVRNGSLVLSMQRDRNELNRYARMTSQHRWLDAAAIDALEPDLENRYQRGLFFADEAHLDPRRSLQQLAQYFLDHGGRLHMGESPETDDFDQQRVIDCRGYAARDELPRLRGVKGEMLLLETQEIKLSRPLRLLHPRYPVYLVPRENGQFMLGATMIENDERDRISARSMLELLSMAYAIHPGFAEAEIIEIGVDVRPAFDDNLPDVLRRGEKLYLNGLYRHGFLLGPAMAQRAVNALLDEQCFAELRQCA